MHGQRQAQHAGTGEILKVDIAQDQGIFDLHGGRSVDGEHAAHAAHDQPFELTLRNQVSIRKQQQLIALHASEGHANIDES
jgi:hypothetical protein